MTTDYPTPGPETPPGELEEDKFLEVYEMMRAVEDDVDGWEFDIDQRAAVQHDRGPLQLTAGPGTGKTTVTVASTLKWLLVDGVPPAGIVVTTFTNKAAENLEQRLESALGSLGYADVLTVDEMYVGTSHQLWADIMRDYRYRDYQNVDILDEDAQEMFILRHIEYVDTLADGDAAFFADIVPFLNDDGSASRGAAATAATQLFNRLSQFQVDLEALAAADEPELRRLADGYDEYVDALRAESRCDYARLQERFLEFLQTSDGQRFVEGDPDRDEPPLQRIAVDEYQDVNPLQQAIYFRLARGMPASRPTLVVVGDDDQALYRFRGGTVDCLIEFPERLAEFLGLPTESVTTEQLRWNYRSRPDIVRWVNRHIGDHPTMHAPGARAPDKDPLDWQRAPVDHPSVHLLNEDTKRQAAVAFAEQVVQLHDNGYIQDYSQVALLAHSTREYWPLYDTNTFVGECVSALERHGVPVHNPRDKGFLHHEEIQAMLAALALCLDPDLQWAKDNVIDFGSLGDSLPDWVNTLNQVIDRYDATALQEYIEDRAAKVAAAPDGEVMDISIVDLFNRLRSLRPFATWTSDAGDIDRTERLGKLSQLVEAFEGIAEGLTENRHLVTTSDDDYETVSVRILSDFYWTFCRYLDGKGLDDPEDPQDSIPEGHVQVMTVHQAKGLEFPVVFVASLGRQAEKNYQVDDGSVVPRVADQLAPFTDRTPPVDVPTRAERDLVRQFYVAHSRAEEHLVLLGADYYLRDADGETILPSLGADAGIPLTEDWFGPNQRLDTGANLAPTDETVGPPSDDQTRPTYSIVADVLSFRRCKRQYGYLTEHEFAAGSGTQLFAGLAVHQTLDWAHRFYHGDLDGEPGGAIPTRERLREEFDSVVEALRDHRIMPMGADAVDAVFEHVARFNGQVGPELYPQVINTECKLRKTTSSFVLTGVADVITDDDGHTSLVDYKATERPPTGDEYLEDYHEQLLVYAGLYREKTGKYPDSVRLYFLADDDPEATTLELEFDDSDVADAIARFEGTVEDLERTRETNSWSELDEHKLPDEETCDECDVRWDCSYRDYDDR